MATRGRTLAMTYQGGQSGALVVRLATNGGVTQADLAGHDDGQSLGIAFGHGDLAYVATAASRAGNVVRRLNTSTLAWRGWFSTGSVQPHAISVIAAPEPKGPVGVAVTCGIGLALCRRRRRPVLVRERARRQATPGEALLGHRDETVAGH